MDETYYIINSGSLSKKNDSVFFQNENTSFTIPIENIESILIFGNVSFTMPVIKILSDHHIPIFLYSTNGWYISSIMPENYLVSGYVLSKQAYYYNNSEMRLKMAKKFVVGAGKNMSKLCRRLNIGKLDVPVKHINDSASIEELMGIEGNIHIEYLKLINEKLPSKFKMENGRTRRPPRDFINSLMSYLYSVLYGTISAQIFSTHLSPSISFLHEPSERRHSLALDVAEIFRPDFCDRIILKLINLKMLKESDFYNNSGGIFLNDSGKKKILEEFENNLRETLYYPGLGRKVSNRFLIRLELYKIEKQIMENKEYKPYIMR